MTQENLTSSEVSPQLIKREIEKYLGTLELTKEEVILLLRQGAQENKIFMIKEKTYDKMVDCLELNLAQSWTNQEQVVSELLTDLKNNSDGNLRSSERLKNLDESKDTGITFADKVAEILKSRRNIDQK